MKKIIHYCWFGKNPMPELNKKCIESWKKFCPDFKIIEWNESNFNINCCDYVKSAYDNKKWAFVSDYCRFFILSKYGGVYMDTDVEIIKSIDDLPDCFVAFETKSQINSGLIRAANINDFICNEMIKIYESESFIDKDGNMNLTTVCVRETNLLKKYGLKCNNTYQQLKEITVFPKEYFCPMDYSTGKMNISDNTYSIHHFSGSWYSEKDIYSNNMRIILSRFLPVQLADLIATFLSILKFDGFSKSLKKFFSFIIKKKMV